MAIFALALAVLACSVDTGLEATPTAVDGSLCDNSAFVADVSIPDGTAVQPGAKFTKTWRINNSGSCTWSTGYRLVFVDGNAMGGGSTALLAPVPPGTQTDISVAMTAPTTNGTFRGNWQMQNAGGQPFGSVVYVQIKVDGGGTAAPTVTPSPTGSSGNYNVSGNAGTGSALIDCIGAGNKPDFQTTSSDNGNYTCVVPWNWDGQILPSKGSWTFAPSSLPVDNVQANVGGYDFTATAP
jgi:hypothetical protein